MSKDLGEAVENLAADYNIEEIEIFGFCTSICVASNALYLRGLLPNVKISVVENLCGDVDQKSHEAGLTVMKNCQIESKTVEV
jgi:nicotinamidase-related amidase